MFGLNCAVCLCVSALWTRCWLALKLISGVILHLHACTQTRARGRSLDGWPTNRFIFDFLFWFLRLWSFVTVRFDRKRRVLQISNLTVSALTDIFLTFGNCAQARDGMDWPHKSTPLTRVSSNLCTLPCLCLPKNVYKMNPEAILILLFDLFFIFV